MLVLGFWRKQWWSLFVKKNCEVCQNCILRVQKKISRTTTFLEETILRASRDFQQKIDRFMATKFQQGSQNLSLQVQNIVLPEKVLEEKNFCFFQDFDFRRWMLGWDTEISFYGSKRLFWGQILLLTRTNKICSFSEFDRKVSGLSATSFGRVIRTTFHVSRGTTFWGWMC